MQVTLFGKQRPAWVAALAVVALTLLLYGGFLLLYTRELLLFAAIMMIVLFARGDLRRLWNLPSVLLLGYAAYTAVSAFWAISGKFFLSQFSKLFPAVLVFAVLVLRGRAEKPFVRRVMAVVADASAILALMSIEGASTGLLHRFFYDVLNTEVHMAFDTRLLGAFGNSNVESSAFAIGVFFSLALLQEAESKRERMLRAATLAFSAFAFVLVFSMGAILCFAVAVVVYLIASGKERGRVLSLMLSAAVPTLLTAFAAARFFNADGALKLLPALLMLLNGVAVAALDAMAGERLGKALAAHEKALYGALLATVALLAVYILLALRLSAPYTFGDGKVLTRAAPVAPGTHTLQVDADDLITVIIRSRNAVHVLAGDYDQLYRGNAEDVEFTVPEDSREVRFVFTGGEGVTLRSAMVDGETPLMLRYRLLPDFIATRLQGTLTTSSSVMERTTLWRDGLRFFLLKPLTGHGMGSFETGITRVQDFNFETKYVHNHYIQVLLEGGVIAFALFLGALLALAAALWKRRGALREGPFALIYPALAAEFVMNALQMIWDVSMTNVVFLSQTYATYALLVLLCAEPLRVGHAEKAADALDAAAGNAAGNAAAAKKKTAVKKRGKKSAERSSVRPEARLVCLLLPVFVAAVAAGNIAARLLISRIPDTLEAYLSNLALAEKIDLYEHNDARLNYCLQVTTYEAWEHLPQANAYAEKLSRLQSNSIHYYLMEFYFNSQQYDRALDMPLLSAVYAASDEDMWNKVVSILRQGLTDPGVRSPLLPEGETLLPKLMAYYEAWQHRNATALVPIALTPENEAFFEEILALNDCHGDLARTAEILSAYQA